MQSSEFAQDFMMRKMPLSDRAIFVERLSIAAQIVGSVNALAKKAEVSQTALRLYLLKSEPTRPVLRRLAEAAGVSAEWLLGGDAEMCAPGSALYEKAEVALRELWTRSKHRDQGASEAWETFRERFLAGEVLDAPEWIRLALRRAPSPTLGDAVPGSVAKQGDMDAEAVGQVLLALIPEASRLLDREAKARLGTQMVGEVVGGAFIQLLRGVSATDSAPSEMTTRAVLESRIYDLNPKWSLFADAEAKKAA